MKRWCLAYWEGVVMYSGTVEFIYGVVVLGRVLWWDEIRVGTVRYRGCRD